jgi:hypothetical protein
MGNWSLRMTVPLDRQKNIAAVAPRVREQLGLGSASVEDATAFATSAQGDKADSALPANELPIYGTVQSLSSLVIPSAVTAFRTNGFLTAGDGGAWPLVVEVPDTGDVEPWQRLSNGGTRRWELVTDNPCVEMFGFGAEAPAALNRYMVAKGLTHGRVYEDFSAPSLSVPNRSNIFLEGPGTIEGYNRNLPSYRHRLVPESSPVARAFPDFNGNLLRKAHLKRDLKIVLVGSSSGTYLADARSTSDTFPEWLKAEFVRCNPKRAISFVSRAIGGTVLAHLDGTPPEAQLSPVQYPWYTDPQRAWLDYIGDEAPDIVVLQFGSNDGAAISIAALRSVVSKLQAMPTAPELVFVTQQNANLSPDPAQSTFGTYAAQEGRDLAAGILRTYAKFYGHPLIDLNRTFNLIRDGRDLLDCHFEEQATEAVTNGRYQAPNAHTCRDWSAVMQVAPEAWSNAAPFSVTLSTKSGNGIFLQDVGGFIRLTAFMGESTPAYRQVDTGIPTPTAQARVTMEKHNGVFRLLIGDNASSAAPFSMPIIHGGGVHNPIFGYWSATTGPLVNMTFRPGRERRYKPIMTDIDMFGIPSSTTGMRPVTGGNGVNHLSSKGAAFLYGEHFNAQDLHIPLSQGVSLSDGRVLGEIPATSIPGVAGFGTLSNAALGLLIDSVVNFVVEARIIRPITDDGSQSVGVTNFRPRMYPFLVDAADDVAAAAAGVPKLALYRTGNTVKVRLS